MKKSVLLLGIALPLVHTFVSPAAAQGAAPLPPLPIPDDATPAPAPVVPPVATVPAARPAAAHATPAPAAAPTGATPPTIAPAAPVTPAPAAPTTGIPPVPAGMDDTARVREATLAYNAGLAALKRNEWNVAAEAFTKAASLTPTDAGAFSFLGYVRLQQKRWDDALAALQSAQDNGKDLDVRARAQLLNNIGFARWNKGQGPESRAAFEEALKLDPTYYDARYNLAFSLLTRDLYADALPHLRQLATINKTDASIQDGLAEALEKTGNIAGALGAYKRSAELDPKNESYRFKFALALLGANRRPDATEQLRQVLLINPNNAGALLQLGDIHLRSNRFNDAAAALKRYVALRNADFTGRFNLGVALDYGARFDEALAQYAEAEKLKPSDAATKNNVGRIYFKREKFDEAVAKFNEALALDANFYDARTNLAIVYAAQGKWDDSNVQWQKLADSASEAARSTILASVKKPLEARVVTAHSGLASNDLAQSKWKEAADEYKRLLVIAPTNLDAKSGLGRALYSLKDYAGAEAAYRDIITANPKDANAYNDLGVVLEAKKDKRGALDNYLQALQLNPNHGEAKSNVNRLKGNAPIG